MDWLNSRQLSQAWPLNIFLCLRSQPDGSQLAWGEHWLGFPVVLRQGDKRSFNIGVGKYRKQVCHCPAHQKENESGWVVTGKILRYSPDAAYYLGV